MVRLHFTGVNIDSRGEVYWEHVQITGIQPWAEE